MRRPLQLLCGTLEWLLAIAVIMFGLGMVYLSVLKPLTSGTAGLARRSGHVAAVELLLRHGADPSVAMDDKHTALARETPNFLKPKPKA